MIINLEFKLARVYLIYTVPIQKIDGNTVRRNHISSSNGAHTSVGGKNDNRGKSAFKSSIQESEAFNIEHVNLREELFSFSS